jgi:hypothetical protein
MDQWIETQEEMPLAIGIKTPNFNLSPQLYRMSLWYPDISHLVTKIMFKRLIIGQTISNYNTMLQPVILEINSIILLSIIIKEINTTVHFNLPKRKLKFSDCQVVNNDTPSKISMTSKIVYTPSQSQLLILTLSLTVRDPIRHKNYLNQWDKTLLLIKVFMNRPSLILMSMVRRFQDKRLILDNQITSIIHRLLSLWVCRSLNIVLNRPKNNQCQDTVNQGSGLIKLAGKSNLNQIRNTQVRKMPNQISITIFTRINRMKNLMDYR